MRLALVLLVLLLAGCAGSPAQTPRDGLDLTGRHGTLLLDLQEERVTPLSEKEGLAWMSPSGALLVWTDVNFATLLDRSTGAREVVPLVVWSRILDDGAGVELAPGEARVRNLLTGATLETRELPPAPEGARAWGAASSDFTVLGAELPSGPPGACQHQLHLRLPAAERVTGCHLKVARDGRVGWTQEGTLVVRAPGAAAETWAEPTDTTTHENPVFADDRVLALRLTKDGRGALVATHVMGEDGEELASLAAPSRLALLDVSADARWLLVRVF